MTDFAWTHLLYRLYDADEQLLYIGRTNDLKTRFAQHSKVQPWWSDVARSAVETLPDLDTLKAAEKTAIIGEKPKHNIVYNGRVVADANGEAAGTWITINPRVTAAADVLHEQCRMNFANYYPDEVDPDAYMPPCDFCAVKAVDVIRAIDEVTGVEDETVDQVEFAVIHAASARALAQADSAAVVRVGGSGPGKCLCTTCVEGWARFQRPRRSA